MKKFFATRDFSKEMNAALFFLRLVCGIAFMYHGSGKIQNPMGWMGPGAPVPGILQALAAIAEFGGGLAWVLGLLTPLASFGIACTMAVAVYTHKVVMGDPFVNLTGGSSYELASVFFAIAVFLAVASPGSFSLDRKIFGLRSR